MNTQNPKISAAEKRIYATCRAVAVREERRRSYRVRGEFWGITASALFLRDRLQSRDTVIPWSEIQSIHRDLSYRKHVGRGFLVVESETKKIEILLGERIDVEIIPFLNSLSDHAKTAGVDTKEVDEIRDSFVYDQKSDMLLELLPVITMMSCFFIVPPIVALLHHMLFFEQAIQNVIDLIGAALANLDESVQKGVLLGGTLFGSVLLGFVVFYGGRPLWRAWEGFFARKRIALHQRRIAALSEQDWALYRQQRAALRQVRHLERADTFFGPAPRRAGKSLYFAVSDSGYELWILFLMMTLFFTTLGAIASFDRDFARRMQWYRWQPAGTAVVSKIERTGCKNPSHVTVELTRTMPEGAVYRYKDESHHDANEYAVGNEVPIKQYGNHPEKFRLKSENDRVENVILFMLMPLATLILYVFLLVQWCRMVRSAKRLFEQGQWLYGTLYVQSTPLRIRGMEQTFAVIRSYFTQGPQQFLYIPGMRKVLSASTLVDGTRYDEKDKSFHFSPSFMGVFLPALLLIATIEILVIAVAIFCVRF